MWSLTDYLGLWSSFVKLIAQRAAGTNTVISDLLSVEPYQPTCSIMQSLSLWIKCVMKNMFWVFTSPFPSRFPVPAPVVWHSPSDCLRPDDGPLGGSSPQPGGVCSGGRGQGGAQALGEGSPPAGPGAGCTKHRYIVGVCFVLSGLEGFDKGETLFLSL